MKTKNREIATGCGSDNSTRTADFEKQQDPSNLCTYSVPRQEIEIFLFMAVNQVLECTGPELFGQCSYNPFHPLAESPPENGNENGFGSAKFQLGVCRITYKRL